MNTNTGAQSVTLGGRIIRINGGSRNVLAGGNNTFITNSTYAFIGNGASNQINTSNQGNAIIAGTSNNITAGTYAGIFGGNNNSINTSAGQNVVILGGANNTISNGNHGFILGGFNNTLSSNKAWLLGTDSTTVSGGAYSGAVGGISHTVSHDYSVVIGGQSLSTSKADEVVVPNLTTTKQVIGSVTAIIPTTATGSLDCSVGNYFTMTLDSGTDVRLEASNITAGQTINLKLTNNGVSAGTISFGPEFEFENGVAFTATAATNAVDIMTFVSFDGTSLQATGLKNFS